MGRLRKFGSKKGKSSTAALSSAYTKSKLRARTPSPRRNESVGRGAMVRVQVKTVFEGDAQNGLCANY